MRLEEVFRDGFRDDLTVGDTLQLDLGGVHYTATIHFDEDSRVDDYDCYSDSERDAWFSDEWYYYGVSVEATTDGDTIDLASLWSIESLSGREYFTSVANELLCELLIDAGERGPESVSYTHLTLPTICSV